MLSEQYPALFEETVWPWGPVQVKFELLQRQPPDQMIAQVNVVPHIDQDWVVIQISDGSWDIPGGTLEVGENYLAAARREIREEVGGQLKDFELFGGWRCVSLAPKPYRVHLPHPEFYRVVGLGRVESIELPTNPGSGEQVIRVVQTSLAGAIDRLRQTGREDLADLYDLAARFRQDRSVLEDVMP